MNLWHLRQIMEVWSEREQAESVVDRWMKGLSCMFSPQFGGLLLALLNLKPPKRSRLRFSSCWLKPAAFCAVYPENRRGIYLLAAAQIWVFNVLPFLRDTSGQGRFCTIFRSYSRGAQVRSKQLHSFKCCWSLYADIVCLSSGDPAGVWHHQQVVLRRHRQVDQRDRWGESLRVWLCF